MQDNNPFVMNTDARDGMHPGPDWHERVAEYYFQAAKPTIEHIIKCRASDKMKEANGIPYDKNLKSV